MDCFTNIRFQRFHTIDRELIPCVPDSSIKFRTFPEPVIVGCGGDLRLSTCINLEGAAGKTGKYTAYLVNNLIAGNQSTTTDPLWLRGVGGIEIMYPASASIVNCTIADNTAAHPTNPIGGVSISGYSAAEKGIAAIANSIVWHGSGKDILPDANGTLWIAYSSVKDATISGTGVIHTPPGFVSPSDYHLTDSSTCRNTGSAAGTILTGAITKSPWSYLPDIGYKNAP